MELREAFLERRRPAVAWGPFNAAIQSLSLVANPEAASAALQLCDVIEDFTLLFHDRQPADLEELRPIHTALDQGHLKFVNATRRSLHPSQERLTQTLGGPSPWRGVAFVDQGDGAGEAEQHNESLHRCFSRVRTALLTAEDHSTSTPVLPARSKIV